ncbi:MAG: DNA repair protein RecO [Clostridia bacterium]|nr:DNA repair protein RecO [Clostridia bacterium]
MEEKLTGLVLSKTDYGENDKIIKIFTLEKGTVSASLKGVKKAGAKLKFASEPFCFAEFLISERAGRRTVTGASLNDSFYPVREDVTKFFAAGAVLEFVRRFAKEDITSPELFFSAIEALKNIAYGGVSPRRALCAFLISALKIIGYALNTDECFVCGNEIKSRVFFDAFSGGFLCENCFNGEGREINHATYVALKKIEEKEETTEEENLFALRLLDFYVKTKAEEKINSLQELLKL